MTPDALHIEEAAREQGDAIALIISGRRLGFDELAREIRAIDRPSKVLRASQDLSSLLHIYADLQEHQPLCIVPANTSDAELRVLEERMARVAPDVALVLFTSGSQGHPKGVMLPRQSLIASARASAQQHGWRDGDRWLSPLPLHHIGGLSVILRCLVDRKTAVITPGFDTEEVASLLHSAAITQVSLVPTMLWRLLEARVPAPPTLRLMLLGGASVDARLWERARAANYPVVHSYGMTETASQIVAMGRPLPGVELRIRERRLEVRAPMLMRGYLPPDVDDAWQPENWFRTQDLARIDEDGSVTILGRDDDIIISGGENIDPRQVEAGLLRCSQVATCVALGLSHPEWGQELVALLSTRGQVSERELEEAVAGELSGPMRPKRLMVLAELPLRPTGKVDLQAARLIAANWSRQSQSEKG